MKNIQKLLWLLVLCLSASLYAADWTGAISEPKSTKEIDGKTFYVITSAEELAWFAAQVNAGKTSINAQLANDIKFMDDTSKNSSMNWTPIGKDSSAIFEGTFDGVGKIIYGLHSYQEKFVGMFGVTGVNAVIRNVSLVRASINGLKYGGGIVAFNGGTVFGCTSGGLVSISTSKFGTFSNTYSYSGGIAGWNAGTISGCTNGSSVSSFSEYGEPLSYSGGIAGWNEGTISGCTNGGSVSASSEYGQSYKNNISYSGGIAGWNEGTVSVCTNGGLVSSYASTPSNIINVAYSGGITSYNAGSVRDCLNFGLLSRRGISGGLVGSADSSSSMFNSYSATDSALYGVTKRRYGTVTNCYFDNDILKSYNQSAGLSMHTSDMQSDRFAWILNTTNGTTENSGVWSRDSEDYPIFADSLHKPIYKVVFDDSVETTNRYTNYKGFVVFPENPGPFDGKKFLGWFADDSVKVKETTVFSKDQTVYAVYCEPSSCPTEPSDALVANLPSPTWSVTATGRNFLIHAAPVGKPYALFDLQGKVLAKGRVESPEMTLSTPRAGSYIVRVGNRSVRMNAK